MTDLTPSDGNSRAPVSQLVPVQDRAFAGESRQTINARELHAFLDVKSEFRNWIKNRIEQYGFSEDVDFIAGNFLPGSEQWASDHDFVERVVCGHSGRLTAEQVRAVRLHASFGLDATRITEIVGARNVRQVSGVLSQRHYRRIAGGDA